MELLFEEKQKITQKWLIATVLLSSTVIILVFGYGFYRQIGLGLPFGNNPSSDSGLILISLLMLAIAIGIPWLLLGSYLEIKVYQDGIYFRYVPFIRKYRRINIHSIQSYAVRQYKPIKEFGGWGIRFGFKEKSVMYNISGNLAIELVLIDGKKIFLGTHKPEELKAALTNAIGK